MENVNEILDFAIASEQEAHDFYMNLAEKATQPGMKKLFTQYAQEEAGHKKKLEAVKAGKLLLTSEKKVLDLKIAEYTVEVKASDNMDYQEALLLAMQREKAAFRLYTDIAQSADNDLLRETFLALAQEEAKHKLRFEIEYDDVILAEN